LEELAFLTTFSRRLVFVYMSNTYIFGMRYSSKRNRAVVFLSAAARSIVCATSDFHHSNNNYNNNHSPSNWFYSSPYFYNEIQSIDLSSDDDELSDFYRHHESTTPQDFTMLSSVQVSPEVNDDDWTDQDDVSSDGGCYVSSQALMCQGGGGGSIQDVFPPDTTTDSILQHLMGEDIYSHVMNDVEHDKEEEDDDNDGDDDGHSSMLSNAALKHSKLIRKARCFAGGGSGSKGFGVTPDSTQRVLYRNDEITLQRHQSNLVFLQQSRQTSSNFSTALHVRGGASATVGTELTKRLINSAIVTLLFEGCCGHILEFFKIVMQTSPPGTTYVSVFKDITSQKGVSGLWDGFIPWGVLQAVLKGGVFGLAYEAAENILKPLAQEGKIPMKLAMTLSGGIAGGLQGFVLSPTLLMKTRVMTNEVFRESMSLWQTTWKSMVIGGDIIKKEGLGSLMKGANTFATKRVFDWASRFYFADLFEALFIRLKGSSLSLGEKSVASFLGGVASTVLTLPLDVLVAKTQDAKKAGVKVSAWKLFTDELHKEGWVGLRNNYMKGFEARLLHVCLTTVVIKTMSPIIFNIIFSK
jgi:hypothetical protein